MARLASLVRSSCLLLLVFLLLVPLAPSARTDEDEGDADDSKKAPKTVAVQRRPFTETVEAKGAFVPRAALEMAYEPDAYGGPLEVVSAVEPGPVVVGQELVRFDDEAIGREILDRGRDLFVAKAHLQKSESETRFKRQGVERQRTKLRTGYERAEADLTYYLEVTKPTRIAQAIYNMEGQENRIKDQVEELQQLERMYEADDLTEETEEIVIRRARRNLVRSRQSFGWSKTRHQRLLEVTIPREEHDKRLGLLKKESELRAYMESSEADLRTADIGLEKARTSFERQQEKFQELKADRDALRVRALSEGYAVPGSFSGTGWKDVAGMRRSLEKGGRMKARQVLYTIVQPGNVGVSTSIGEADLLRVKTGQTATVRPGVLKGKVLDATVVEVMRVGSGGKFAVRLDLQETDKALMPGYSCKIEIVTRRVESALVVPAAAVKKDGDRHLVFVWKNGKADEREVKVGATSGKKVEILDGVEEGVQILAKAPEGDK